MIGFGSTEVRSLEERPFAKVFDGEDDRTRQEFKEETTMRNLVRKWMESDQVVPDYDPAQYGDFTQGPDFVEAFNKVRAVQERFADLPAPTRERFSHDPAEMVSYLSSLQPEQVDEAVQLKLVKRHDAEIIAENNPPPPTPPEPPAEPPQGP